LRDVTVKPGRWCRREAGTDHWVKPKLVAEVSFTEWTPDGHVRHPVFIALRSDKPANEITREIRSEAAGALVGSIRSRNLAGSV
jgi:bifunctional non-homologous end joining protein LigD